MPIGRRLGRCRTSTSAGLRFSLSLLLLLLQFTVTVPTIVTRLLLYIVDVVEIALFEMFETLPLFVVRITFRIGYVRTIG